MDPPGDCPVTSRTSIRSPSMVGTIQAGAWRIYRSPYDSGVVRRQTSLLEKVVPDGVFRQLRVRPEPHLGEDPRAMSAHGLNRYRELPRDLLDGLSDGEPPEDLVLPVGKTLVGRFV